MGVNAMNCYGKYYGKRSQCSDCASRRHCSAAMDQPLLNPEGTPDWMLEKVLSRCPSSTNRFAKAERDRRYSRADLLEVIAFMVSMDRSTLEMIAVKLDKPDLKFADIARAKGVSRQAVHKMVKKRILAELPELAPLVDSRQAIKRKNREAYEARVKAGTQCDM